MRILYITDYFNTPKEGGLLRTWAISKYLTKKEHKVTVMCRASHHMTGEVSPELKDKAFYRENIGGIDVIKTYSYPHFRDSYLNRILHYLIFPFLIFIRAIFIRKPDVIITSSPPLFLLPFGFLLCKLKNKKFIVEIRDAWLEFALARDLIPKIFIKPVFFLREYTLKKAERIIAVTPGIKKVVDRTVGNNEKSVLVMNGFEEDIDRMSRDLHSQIPEIKKEYKLGGKFIVIYTGTLGLARDHEIFGRTAKLLKDYEDIMFLFIGAGEKKKELQTYCENNRLDNCKFLPLQPRTKIPLFLALSHVGINSIRKDDALESSFSNKIFDYLGNGVPVVFSGEGDTADFLKECGGGIVAEPENAPEMRDAILKLYKNPELRKKMGDIGQKFVLGNYTRTKMLEVLEKTLLEVVVNPLSPT